MEDSVPPEKKSLSVPFAIVIAGGLIALAVFFTRDTGPATSLQPVVSDPASGTLTETEMTIRAINASDHSLGNPSAPVSMIVYTDTECPYCKSFHSTTKQISDLYGKNGKVLIVYRHFPLIQIHSRAQKEAEATECAVSIAGKAAFWSYVDEIFSVTPSNNGLDPAELPKIASRIGITGENLTKFNECLSSGKFEAEVSTDLEEAVNAGGRGTPFSIFVLSKPLKETSVETLEEINAGFMQQGESEGPFSISKDKKRVSMSGALPLAYLQRVIDLFLAN